jgi:hypothetical protein
MKSIFIQQNTLYVTKENYSSDRVASQTQTASFKSDGFSQVSGLVISQTSLLTKVGGHASNFTQ